MKTFVASTLSQRFTTATLCLALAFGAAGCETVDSVTSKIQQGTQTASSIMGGRSSSTDINGYAALAGLAIPSLARDKNGTLKVLAVVVAVTAITVVAQRRADQKEKEAAKRRYEEAIAKQSEKDQEAFRNAPPDRRIAVPIEKKDEEGTTTYALVDPKTGEVEDNAITVTNADAEAMWKRQSGEPPELAQYETHTVVIVDAKAAGAE